MNIVIVGGDFSNKKEEIRKSGFITKFSQNLIKYFETNYSDLKKTKNVIKVINGGNITELNLIKENIKNIDVLFWFPNISNDEDKFLPSLKALNPKLYLIQSKYNGGRYSFLQLVARALQSKSNLLLEFNKIENGLISTKIIDPLGNVFYNGTNLEVMVKKLMDRLLFISKTTREPSIRNNELPIEIPKELEFFKVIENYGEIFHELIHAINQDRFLGNASFRKHRFRCSYGFPSFKGKDNVFYVSKRNVDKRNIDENSFVPVSLEEGDSIEYNSDNKPSVDTPIQKRLYNVLPKINYMIHAHVYIEEAPFTKTPIPCGSLEEVDEILEVIEDYNKDFFAINLIGHGCIVMSNDIDKLRNLKFIPRKDEVFYD